MKKPYHVLPCDEPDGSRTWDVIRRANDVNGNVVSNHKTRNEAREEAHARNHEAGACIKCGAIRQATDQFFSKIEDEISTLQDLLKK